MATHRLAWVLNLDADVELAASGPYEPTKKVRSAMAPHVEHLAETLVGPNDLVVDETSAPGSAQGLVGRAFCPTPRALRILERAGAVPEPHPSVDVLRRVNSRAFAAALGSTLPGSAFVTSLEIAKCMLASDPGVGRAWRVKHAFGMAGRNQRVIEPAPMTERDLEIVTIWMRTGGGVQIEPDVAIETEYALHGVLATDGALRTGDVVTQRCDPRGGWLATERITPLSSSLAAATATATAEIVTRLTDEVAHVARSLHAAGYFGPFGVDAYTYRDRTGALSFQPRSEINARYSMGFAVGLDRHREP